VSDHSIETWKKETFYWKCRITELKAELATAKGYGHWQTIELDKVRAELACYKAFADNYIEKRYANLPKLKADLKELEDGRA
jgi:hypothetical protein